MTEQEIKDLDKNVAWLIVTVLFIGLIGGFMIGRG